MSERVSVVIPVHQGERFVAQAIETALAQDRPPDEVIVVDDGSTDDSGKIARAHPVHYVRQANAGVAAARNTGLEAATGDYIAMLDQDDLWEPHKLRVQLTCLQERPDVGWVTCRTRWLLEPGTPMAPWMRPEWFEEPQYAFITSAMLARRRTFEIVGAFDTSYVQGSDSDWLMRARDAGLPPTTIEEVLVHRRIHGANNSNDLETGASEMARILKASLDRRRSRGGGRLSDRARPRG